MHRLLTIVASLAGEHRLQGTLASEVEAHGLSRCGSQALVHRLSSCGAPALVAPRHVESSWTTDRTGRWILTHGTTREVPKFLYIYKE